MMMKFEWWLKRVEKRGEKKLDPGLSFFFDIQMRREDYFKPHIRKIDC